MNFNVPQFAEYLAHARGVRDGISQGGGTPTGQSGGDILGDRVRAMQKATGRTSFSLSEVM